MPMHMQLIPYWHAGDIDSACRFCNQNSFAEHVFHIRQHLEYRAEKKAICTLILFRIDKIRAPILRCELGITPSANPALLDNSFTRGL